MAESLLTRHRDYIAGLKAKGHPTVMATCPHCGQSVEFACPSEPGEVWTSVMTCPYCHMSSSSRISAPKEPDPTETGCDLRALNRQRERNDYERLLNDYHELVDEHRTARKIIEDLMGEPIGQVSDEIVYAPKLTGDIEMRCVKFLHSK